MEPRKYQSGASATPPSAPVSPSTGYPTEGDALTATPATIPGPYWFYQLGEELRNVLVQAGITPDHADLTQLADAVQALAANGASIAEMVAAAITDKAVTPARQKYHPMHIKKVVRFQGRNTDGTCTVDVNLGGTARVERKTHGGTTQFWRVLWSSSGSGDDMSSGTYSVLALAQMGSSPGSVGAWGAAIGSTQTNIAVVSPVAQDATGVLLKAEGSGAGAAVDPDFITLIVLGTLP